MYACSWILRVAGVYDAPIEQEIHYGGVFSLVTSSAGTSGVSEQLKYDGDAGLPD